MIPSRIFRRYDIRGQAQEPNIEITSETAYRIGQAFGTMLQNEYNYDATVIGQDNRLTSPDLADGFTRGLQSTGCTVHDLGVVSTPIVYWSAIKADHIGGVMVTGSHLPPEKNGFKLCVGKEALYGEQIQKLYQRIQSVDFLKGSGTRIEERYARKHYIADLRKRIHIGKSLRVVIDAGNGTGGMFAPELLEAWGLEVSECLFCEPDGRYPNHQPDPSKSANMQSLIDAVLKHKADIGLAFDGDADRIGVVDEKGTIIPSDRLMTLLAKDILSRHAGAKIIADVTCSQTLFDEVEKAGGEPIIWMTGHSLIKSKMQAEGALLGGEISGHIFIADDYYGFDDGYYSAGRLLQILSQSGQTLSEMDASIPKLCSTPVHRIQVAPEMHEEILLQIKNDLRDQGEVNTIDGLRVRFEHGWGGIRASNTEPVLSMRIEGTNEEFVASYQQVFFDILRKFPNVELPDQTL